MRIIASAKLVIVAAAKIQLVTVIVSSCFWSNLKTIQTTAHVTAVPINMVPVKLISISEISVPETIFARALLLPCSKANIIRVAAEFITGFMETAFA